MSQSVNVKRPAARMVLLAGAALVGVACGGGPDVSVPHAAVPHVGDSIYVEIVNEHFNDARVHAIYDGGHRYTLGLVVGHSKAPLNGIPWQPHPLVLEISFIAAGGPYYTHDLLLAPGDVITVRIPPNIATSAFFRRR
jgi:hypothetical protein